MAIRSLTYTDIPLAQRRESAAKTLERIKERINDPVVTPELRQQLTQQLVKLEQWANTSDEGN
jgi:hypothetical protein